MNRLKSENGDLAKVTLVVLCTVHVLHYSVHLENVLENYRTVYTISLQIKNNLFLCGHKFNLN